jgi:hypothetical protein
MGNVRLKITLWCFHVTTVVVEKSECVFVALVIQHAKRMHRIVLPSVDSQALPYINT